MKNLVIKSGLFKYVNRPEKVTENEVNLNKWLYKELIRYGLSPNEPCCDNDDTSPPTTNTDTRLTNPHVVGPNFVFDLLNVVTNVITPNFVSIPLTFLNITTTLVDNGDGTATYTNEAGVATTITLGGAQTPLTVIDTNTIDFTTSGTDNHTLTANVKISATANNDLTEDATGLFLDVKANETITSITMASDKVLTYTDEDGTATTYNVLGSTPTKKATFNGDIDVTGTIDPTRVLFSNLSGTNSPTYNPSANNNDFQIETSENGNLNFKTTTTPSVLRLLDTGEVGVNNPNPTETLDVIGNFKLANGSEGLNKILTSDANGLATWVSPSIGSTTVSNSFTAPNLITTVNGVSAASVDLTTIATADNGLTKTALNTQLGGNLIQNTTIAGSFDLNLNMNKVLIPKSSHFGVLNTFATANLAQFDLNATVSQVQFKNASNQSIMYIRQDGVSVWGTNNAAIKLSSTGTNSDITGQYFVIGAPQNSATSDNGSTGGGIILYGRGGTATSGSQSGTAVINEVFNPASGNRTYNCLNVFGSYGQSGTATGSVTGIKYDKSGTVTGTHYGLIIGPNDTKSGFGMLNPNSTVEVNGSTGLKVQAFPSANPVLGSESVCYFVPGCSGTITLPTITNRTYYLVNYTGGNLTTSLPIRTAGLTTTTTLPSDSSWRVIYTGTEWILISN